MLVVGERRFDVIVVGGGNAGLCAAMAAADRGRRVLLVERSPAEWRGGNTKYTRDIRVCHDGPSEFLSGGYGEDEFLEDLIKVTGGNTNRELAKAVIQGSYEVPRWMEEHGVHWQRPLKGTLHLSRTNLFFIGGGKTLVNTYYEYCRRKGVKIVYCSSVVDIEVGDDWLVKSVLVDEGSTRARYLADKLIAAAGGFEANVEWHKKYWGKAANNFVIRGSRFNDGLFLQKLVEKGAKTVGDPTQFHAIAVDARSPKYEGGIVTRIDSVPFSIVVNRHGERFYDEGEDLWPKRYAIWGRLIAEQPDQIAYSIFDSKSKGAFLPTLYPPIEAESIAGLAKQLGLEPLTLEKTVSKYNQHVVEGRFDPSTLDDCHTVGLEPPKSHWAQKIDSPPFYAYPLRPGITFTYLGVAVDTHGRVLRENGEPFPNIYAAGEIMAGNILTRGYLGGFGLTIGTVFGIKAGEEAASRR